MDEAKVKERLRRYQKAYYNDLRALMATYPTVHFPEFLTGTRRVVATWCKNGVALHHYSAPADSFEFSRADKSVEQVIADYSDGLLSVSFVPGQHFDYKMMGLSVDIVLEGNGPVTWTPSWTIQEYSDQANASRWSPELAKSHAYKDVSIFVGAHLMNVQPSNSSPDAILARLDEIISGFETLLDANPREEELQRYLSANPILLAPTAEEILPKVRLDSFVTDFVIRHPGRHYVLVEIEQAGHQLFNSKGDPSATLTHAVGQVKNWRQWIRTNIAFAQKLLPDIVEPAGWVVIGREVSGAISQREFLSRENNELQGVTILTYDDLTRLAKQHLHNLHSLR